MNADYQDTERTPDLSDRVTALEARIGAAAETVTGDLAAEFETLKAMVMAHHEVMMTYFRSHFVTPSVPAPPAGDPNPAHLSA